MALWSHLLEKYPSRLTILPNTPVAAISSGSKPPFLVLTTQGDYPARHVIHATNAYASQLIHSLKGRIVPVRGHMTAQRPGPSFRKFAAGRSWSVVYPGAFDYVTQRPGADSSGDVIIGGGLNRSASRGADAIGVSNDDGVDGSVIRYLEGVFPALFEGQAGGTEADMAWSGIFSVTPDGLPFVGRLERERVSSRPPAGKDPSPAEWIAAGYNGEGMVFAFLCGAALAAHVAGRENELLPRRPGVPGGKVSEWFPPELYVTKERLEGRVRGGLEGAFSGVPAPAPAGR